MSCKSHPDSHFLGENDSSNRALFGGNRGKQNNHKVRVKDNLQTIGNKSTQHLISGRFNKNSCRAPFDGEAGNNRALFLGKTAPRFTGSRTQRAHRSGEAVQIPRAKGMEKKAIGRRRFGAFTRTPHSEEPKECPQGGERLGLVKSPSPRHQKMRSKEGSRTHITHSTCSTQPVNGSTKRINRGIGAIVNAKKYTKLPPKVNVNGFRATDNVETCALDSGACEAVLSPQAFSNTNTVKGANTGMKYLACGGEKVTNLGEKHVAATDSEGNLLKLTFQCTDKITRNLAAASKICESGKGVYLGPGPDYTAYILHRPDMVKLGSGPKTPLGLRNGVYEFNLRELVPRGGDLCGGEPQGTGYEPQPIPLAEDDPYSDAHISQSVDDIGDDHDGDAKGPKDCEMSAPKYQAPVKTIKDPCLPSQKEIDEHFVLDMHKESCS